MRKFDSRRGPRRPDKKVEHKNSRRDHEYMSAVETQLIKFAEDAEEGAELHLDPMNSYYRRLTHQLSKEYKFDSSSDGEGPQRHVVLKKVEETTVPDQRKIVVPKTPIWDFGNREFPIVVNLRGTEVGLAEDGTFGVIDKTHSPGEDLLDRRLVFSGSIRIKKNKILEFTDEDW